MTRTALRIGPLEMGAPVVLAPMAGVTNPPFRRLCRESGEAGLVDAPASPENHGVHGSAASAGRPADPAASPKPRAQDGMVPFAPAGLYVCEMITSRALVERKPATLQMVEPEPGDPVRSVQLYGVEPTTMGEAARILVTERYADHIDLNFGCPVPKVTRKGGGAALPWKLDLFEAILESTVSAAREASRAMGRGYDVPVTIKMRMGIDDDHLTFLDAARIAQRAGVAAVGLHARTLEQHYSGQARWEHITELRRALPDIPVLGNGDVWTADDAARMMRETGCDGVVVGRGCQGRPWLFTDLVAALAPDGRGTEVRVRPGLRRVTEVMVRHGELLIEFFGNEHKAIREMRKHIGWYLKGYPVGGAVRRSLVVVETLEELRAKLADLDLDIEYPGEPVEGPRGRAGHARRPHLPNEWLASRELDDEFREVLAAAEIDVSGG